MAAIHGEKISFQIQKTCLLTFVLEILGVLN